MTDAEFRVVDDPVGAAFELYLEVAPTVVLLTGGRTPLRLYERLATTVDRRWEDTECFLSDERCVPTSDPRSNVGQIDRVFLSKVQATPHPIDGDSGDADGYEAVLRERFDGEPTLERWFHLALYGLGPDGHTASLFPGRPEVDEMDDLAVYVPEAGWEPFVPRVSLTVPVLSSAAVGVFLVSGRSKREALRRLLDGEDIPAARMRPERLLILADRGAAPA